MDRGEYLERLIGDIKYSIKYKEEEITQMKARIQDLEQELIRNTHKNKRDF